MKYDRVRKRQDTAPEADERAREVAVSSTMESERPEVKCNRKSAKD